MSNAKFSSYIHLKPQTGFLHLFQSQIQALFKLFKHFTDVLIYVFLAHTLKVATLLDAILKQSLFYVLCLVLRSYLVVVTIQSDRDLS